ncbi:MAG: VIT1/CCC1 transporter family protein [Bacteroidia bacterium]|nr:VIT1/CCC1 transporter family protein [Bacteroidia bacterium]
MELTHEEKHFRGSAIVRDFVIGMSDGLTVPFALAAGLSGAVSSSEIVITAGLAEIAAGAIAMGLGGFMAGRTEMDHFDSEMRREYYEIETLRHKEIAETREIFAEFGVSEEVQTLVAEEIAKDPKKWVDFMMKFELGLEKPHKHRALQSAFIIGISYIIGGIIPLMPYFMYDNAMEGLKYSVFATLGCLLLFGFIKSKITARPVFKGALSTAFIGLVAAGCAYGIAKLIAH